jgi:hypothetical protein
LDNGVHVSADGPIAFPALPVLAAGARLEPGGVYLDLARPQRGPFRALAGQIAGSRDRYVAQRDVSCARWWRLVEAAAFAARGEAAIVVDQPGFGAPAAATIGITTFAAAPLAAAP